MPFIHEVTYVRSTDVEPYVGPKLDCAGTTGHATSTWYDRCERAATKIRDGRWPLCATHARQALVRVAKSAALER
jgi:hypothetical protein